MIRLEKNKNNSRGPSNYNYKLRKVLRSSSEKLYKKVIELKQVIYFQSINEKLVFYLL